MKLLRLILLFAVLLPVQVLSMDLPRGHVLKQNDRGEYYVENSGKITMIEPSIISIGYNKKWILACIRNTAIDSDEKRMVFINLQNGGGTTDTINRDNWKRFEGIYPDLTEITLKPLQDETCP